MNLVTVRDVSKRFGTHTVLDHVDLVVEPETTMVIVGKSGCGKTTLLRIICGLTSASSGSVELAINKRRVGYVPQSPSLLSSKNVRDNICLPIMLISSSNAEFERIITLLELDNLLDKFPHQLSRGQAQRVALARAMMIKPDLLVMDEPFASLDELTKERLDTELLSLKEAFGLSIIMVTHSVEEAIYVADRIAVFTAQKKIRELAIKFKSQRTPSIKNTPQFFSYQKRVRTMI